MATERVAVQVPVRPWFRDHCFNGRIIFPAVEAMQLLAVTAQAAHPQLNVGRMHQGRFTKFLEIPPEAAGLDVLVELETSKNGDIHARLMTKIQRTTMTRTTSHCELCFAVGGWHEDTEVEIWPLCSAGPQLTLSAAQVYRDLVPFGPAYQTLHDRLFLTAGSAWGTLRAPALEYPLPETVGSPFPLDGAMHAACVHGQRLVDFVPFPVGFATRIIHKPTRAGERYRTHVQLQSCAAEELVYDILIFDQAEQIRETITGLHMRDGSGGRIKPPAWIRRVSGEDGWGTE